jgi:hypothetical protein
VAQGDFVLVKLAGKTSIFHYIAQVMNDFDGNEYEIRYYKRIENTNKFILDKENEYFSITNTDILRKLPPPAPAGSSKQQGSQLCFTVAFSGFNVKSIKATYLPL